MQGKTRQEVLTQLARLLPGQELSPFALKHGITIEKNGKTNKGWVGLTIERMADLAASNRPQRDGLDFELKTTKIFSKNGTWHPKETIKVTQLNPALILEEEFESSTLWNKMQSLVIVGCHYETPIRCRAVSLCSIDINDPLLKSGIQAFWEEVRHTVAAGEIEGYHNLGTYEEWLQLRPTGNGKLSSTCPISGAKFPARAFYATKKLLNKILETEIFPLSKKRGGSDSAIIADAVDSAV